MPRPSISISVEGNAWNKNAPPIAKPSLGEPPTSASIEKSKPLVLASAPKRSSFSFSQWGPVPIPARK